MSIRPVRSSTRRRPPPPPRASVTSTEAACAWPPAARISSTTGAAWSSRAAANTTAPRAASCRAIARPIPRDAPVTRATRPSNRPVTTCLLQHTGTTGATAPGTEIPPAAAPMVNGSITPQSPGGTTRGSVDNASPSCSTTRSSTSRAAMRDPVLDRARRRSAMRHHGHGADAEQRRAAILGVVHTLPKPAERARSRAAPPSPVGSPNSSRSMCSTARPGPRPPSARCCPVNPSQTITSARPANNSRASRLPMNVSLARARPAWASRISSLPLPGLFANRQQPDARIVQSGDRCGRRPRPSRRTARGGRPGNRRWPRRRAARRDPCASES